MLNIINETKESAQLRSAEFYLDAIEQAIMRENMSSGGSFKPSSCVVQDSGNLLCEGYADPIEVEVSGEVPNEGSTITIENGKIKDVELELNGKTIPRQEGVLAVIDYEKLDENATDASCFGVEPIISEYEIGDHCDEFFQGVLGDEELLRSDLEDEEGPGAILLYLRYFMFEGAIDNISIEELEEAGTITNVKDTNTVSITNYTCGGLEDNKDAIRDVIIPNKIKGKLVAKISQDAFEAHFDCNKEELIEEKLINSVVIPNSVITIEDSAFSENQLTSVNIGNGVTTIENSVFGNNQLTSVVIKGKSSAAEFEYYRPEFGWASGYSDANITWQP